MAFSRVLQLTAEGKECGFGIRSRLVRDQALAKKRPTTCIRRSRSREDFVDFCLVGGKLSLQVCTQKRKPVISPKDLVVHCKGWDTEYPDLNCTFRLKTEPFFDFSRLGLAQKLLSIEADAISNLRQPYRCLLARPRSTAMHQRAHRSSFLTPSPMRKACARTTEILKRILAASRCHPTV
jgi:hypothetical protein